MSRRKYRIRVSSLPAFSICPSFNRPPSGVKLYDDFSPPAAQGSAAHAAVELWLPNEEIPDFESIALRYPSVDVEDLRICFFMWRRIYVDEMSLAFPCDSSVEIVSEESLEARLGEVKIDATGEVVEVWLTGHIDFILRSRDEVHIYDWKFGREAGTSHLWQTAGYAALEALVNGFPECGFITVGEVHVRHNVWREHTQEIDLPYLTDFRDVLLRQVAASGAKIASPDSCKFCKLAPTCDAYPRLFAKSFAQVKAIAEEPSGGFDYIESASSVTDLVPSMKLLEYAVKDFKETLKAYLESKGASEEQSVDGYILKPRVSKSVDLKVGAFVLRDTLSPDQISSILPTKLKLSDVLKKATETTPDGMSKKEYKVEIERRFRDAGAVLESRSLSPTKAPPPN